MPQRVLIVPDKFKGTLSARGAAQAIARGWRETHPNDELELLPMSDGGDGFGEVLSRLLGAKPRTVNAMDAARRPCKAAWWWESQSKTAIIESANVIGLAMLPVGKYHPFELDTFGLAAALLAAHSAGAKQILIGIGGSATNDGGFGLARALGWEFRDHDGHLIERWKGLHKLAQIRPAPSCRFGSVRVAVDVQNPLLGVRGATRVYGPQKGIRRQDLAHAERCLRRVASVVKRQFGRDIARMRGAGAAGGLGFGLTAFLGAELQPGFELFATNAKLSRRLRAAGLVITGEGAVDRSTAMGKGVGQIARRCRKLGIPCLCLSGAVVRSHELTRLFDEIYALTDLTTEAEAKAKPSLWLERLATLVAQAKA